MNNAQRQIEFYSGSVRVSRPVRVPDDEQVILVQESNSLVPAEIGSRSEAGFYGQGNYTRVFNFGTEYTGSISPCTQYAVQRASNDFSTMVSRVLELLQVEDEVEDDFGAVVPTKFALQESLRILSETFRELKTVFPLAPASVSFDGGIRIEWMRPDSSLRLVIQGGEEEEAYIYHEHEDKYGTEPASAQNLVQRIRWLQRKSSHVESTT